MKKSLKALLIILSIFITGIITCQASTKTFDRNKLDNYGVNKDWNITSNNKDNILKTPAVDAEEKIYDYTNVLTDEEEAILKEKIDKFIKNTNMDMVIVIPNFYYSVDKQNEEYAADFYDYNDFGMKYENNSGVLFLRNAYRSDPYYNIYTFGNAQLYFSFSRLETILDDIYADIKMGNYLEGFSNFIDQMETYYKSGISYEMKNYKVDKKGYLHKIYHPHWLITILVASGITALIMLIMIKKNKMVLKASKATEYLNDSSININEKKDTFITSHTSSYKISSSSGGGGGFSSSSGSSGGGHSSGGGRHG